MVFEVVVGIPFLEETENIFIIQIIKKITGPATLFRSDGIEQRVNGQGQFLALSGHDPHMDENQNHGRGFSKSHANPTKTAIETRGCLYCPGLRKNGEHRKEEWRPLIGLDMWWTLKTLRGRRPFREFNKGTLQFRFIFG